MMKLNYVLRNMWAGKLWSKKPSGLIRRIMLMLVVGGMLVNVACAFNGQSRPLLVADTCTFLPESARPAWLTQRPLTPDYVGVGAAGLKESPEEQIHASEDDARSGVAKEVSVRIEEQVTQNICEGQCSEEERSIIIVKTASMTKRTLKGAQIQQRWLDRGNCMVWTLVTLPKQAVDELLSRQVMVFNRSAPSVEMAEFLTGHLERVLRGELAVVSPDTRLEGCAIDNSQPDCRKRTNTMFGMVSVSLEKELLSPDAQWRQRNFRVKGGLRFQEKLVSSFDVTCQGRAEAKVDTQTIDRAAADACRRKIQKILEKDLERLD